MTIYYGRALGNNEVIIWSQVNEVAYTATPVACWWAGAVFELQQHLGRSSED